MSASRARLSTASKSTPTAVRERFQDTRASYLRATNGQLWGRPANGIESRYLLTGLAQCGLCGGNRIVHSRASAGRRAHAYLCSYNHLRGTTVCPTGLVLPVAATNESVLATIEREVLHPDVVQGALATPWASSTRWRTPWCRAGPPCRPISRSWSRNWLG